MERLQLPIEAYQPRIGRIFANGHSVHERIEKELKLAGIMIQAEAPLHCDELNLHGHTDGIGCITIPDLGGVMVILEIKSIGSKGWKWMIGAGKLQGKGPEKKHVWQVQLYMYMAGINYALIIYENKDTQERKYYVIKRDVDLIQSTLLPRVVEVNDHVKAKSLPRRLPEYIDEEDQGGNVCFDCKYCDYRDVCKAEEKLFDQGQVIDLITLGQSFHASV